jgi:twitching motility protein PilT
MKVDELLQRMCERSATEVYVKVGSPPVFRENGSIVRSEGFGRLKPEGTQALAYSIMEPEQQKRFEADHEVDFGYGIPGLGRFRANVFKQRGSISIFLRRIPPEIPNVNDLGLPEICKTLAMKPKGLVLVTGPTRSGKSTTLAAMVDYINENKAGVILTLESPVEFLHRDKSCIVNQREVGTDAVSFSEGVRFALREHPDVILLSEMHDPATVDLALTAAQTGHLVLGALPTTSATQTLLQLIHLFPSSQEPQVQMRFSVALEGVITQVLIPGAEGGTHAAYETMVCTPEVRAKMRQGEIDYLENILRTGEKDGMQLLEASLARLVREKKVSLENAMARANSPDLLNKLVSEPVAAQKDDKINSGSLGPSDALFPSSAAATRVKTIIEKRGRL